MATKPRVKALTGTSVEILNSIRQSATESYRNYVPHATPDAASIKEIGAIIMQFPALQNEFLNNVVNRIGRVIVTSKTYANPWAFFKKGRLDFGETIEEIFVNLARPFQYDPEVAETNIYKREIPDVRTAFHVRNYQKFYKATVQREELRAAFLSWEGVTDLIARITESLYTGANYDEFLTMKYMLAKHLLNGHIYPTTVPAVTKENAEDTIIALRAVSNQLTFMSGDYNIAGVTTHTPRDDQFVIVNGMFDAVYNVAVLAAAYNMDRAEFIGHHVLVNRFGFSESENARLTELLGDDPGFRAITPEESAALDNVPAIMVDRNWFMIFDNLDDFTEKYNTEGLYWNYWYHVWKTFSISPFSNAVAYVPGTPAVTSVSVSPATATVMKGQTLLLVATVDTEFFAPQAVVWTTDSTLSKIDSAGNLYVSPDETATTIVVTATSTFDATKTATATVTVQ